MSESSPILRWPSRAADDAPPLGIGEVHLWSWSLDAPDALASLAGILASDERARADRFHRPRDRARFIVGRAVLRRLLASYVGRPAGELRFEYGHQGKPALAQPAAARVSFNLAHAGGLALLAVTAGTAVGVDVEPLRELPDAEEIARGYFAPGEIDALARHAPAARSAAFLRGWTRKEAFVKAIGDGLSCPLDSFEVSLGEPDARFLAMTASAGPAEAWTLVHLEPADEHVGALAVRGEVRALHRWRLDPVAG